MTIELHYGPLSFSAKLENGQATMPSAVFLEMCQRLGRFSWQKLGQENWEPLGALQNQPEAQGFFRFGAMNDRSAWREAPPFAFAVKDGMMTMSESEFKQVHSFWEEATWTVNHCLR